MIYGANIHKKEWKSKRKGKKGSKKCTINIGLCNKVCFFNKNICRNE